MKKVAPELDSLMWTVAEEGNERAIDEFGVRHPELRTELLRRMDMVKGLRGEKKRTVEPKTSIPRFVPKESARKSLEARGPMMWAVGLALAALAAAAFAITMMLTQPVHSLPTQVVPPTVEVQPKTSTTSVTQPPSSPAPPAVAIDQSPPTSAQRGADTDLKPFDMKIKGAPLFTVLQMMSAKSGIKIEPAPGLVNAQVDVDYGGMTAMEMLSDLGRRYSFTPEDQHDGSIWIIPAIDTSTALPGSSGKDGTGSSSTNGGMRDRKIGG